MRGTIVIAIVLVLAGFGPVAAGFHLSAGANDAVGVSPEESADDPTVPLDRQSVGLTDPDSCFKAEPTAQSVQDSISTDEFCGQLVYNDLEETDELVQPDASVFDTVELDQHFPSFSMGDGTSVQVTQFDVVQVAEAGFGYFSDGFSTCYVPGSGDVYKDAHDAGNDVGLTPSSEKVEEEEPSSEANPCDIYVGAQLAYPNAVNLAQQETDAMDMNGWMMPNGKTKWIGFLSGNVGTDSACQDVVFDDDVLLGIVKGEETAGIDVNCDGDTNDAGAAGANGGLPTNAVPRVCGFFPAEDPTGFSLESACELEFFWIGPEEKSDPGDGPVFDSNDYTDWCASRAYMCGNNQPAWYAEFLSDALGGHPLNQILIQEHSTTGYDVFHWVAAPTQSDCGGDQEPGFIFQPGPGSDASAPYAGHDLDVYTTPSTAVGVRSMSNVDAAANAVVDDTVGNPVGTVGDALPIPPEVTAAATETQAQVDNATLLVHKNSVQEPNAPGDTSQIAIEGDNPKTFIGSDGSALDADLARSLDDPLPCDILRGTESVADPWVPYFDIRTVRDVSGDGLFVSVDAFDPYLTTDRNQDDQNRPGPFQYFHFGEVGMITDKVDDGFAPDGNNRVFPGADDLYNEDWAYPLFWDMHVDINDNGDVTIDRDGGCEYTGIDQMSGQLPGLMEDAGYGQHTGLINVYYLAEPTYIFNFNTNDAYPFLGEEAFVTMSANYVEILRQGMGDVTDPNDDANGEIATSVGLIRGLINDVLDRMPHGLSNYDGPLVWQPEGVGSGENTVDDQVTVLPVETDPTAPPDFSGNCDFPGYGWQNSWSFGHYCGAPQASVCQGDTVAAGYFMEVTQNGPLTDTVGGTDAIPAFKPDGDSGSEYTFGLGFHKMFDIDPFDNDPNRNLPERTNPCTPADFETGVRVECPHQVSNVEVAPSGTGAIDVSWKPVIEEDGVADRNVGDYDYVIEVRDDAGDLIVTVTDTDDDHEETITGLSAGEVTVTVRGQYNFETQLDTPDGPRPASFDRLGPRSDGVPATVS